MYRGTLGDSDSDLGESSYNYRTRSLAKSYNQPSTSSGRPGTAIAEEPTKPNNTVKGAARRKVTSRQRMLKQLQEIARLQKSTNLLIPRVAFGRVVREISLEINPDISRYTLTALQALQEATEMFLVQILQDSYLLTMHRKAVTLSKADIVLIRSLKLDF